MTKRKRKKDLDFQKVKIRIGRKLKRDIKETKAEFSTRKIVLKEVRSYCDDPLTSLSRHSDRISHQGKLKLLSHFNNALSPEIVKNLTKPIIDSLSKFLLDQSPDVRVAASKCLRTCYNRLKSQQLPTSDFILSLKPYLDCAYTHVSSGISDNCHKFIEYLVNQNDGQLFEPLMMIISKRFEAGHLGPQHENLALKLKQYYKRYKQKESLEEMLSSDRVETFVWTPTNFVLDLDFNIHDLDGFRRDAKREVQLSHLTDLGSGELNGYSERGTCSRIHAIFALDADYQ